jgi:phytoene desaturase
VTAETAGPHTDEYDAVVVGAGLGGLSAAALLAKAGLRVLAVDRQDGPGGCAHAFRRGPYLFDPAVHVTAEVRDGAMLDLLLNYLGVRDRCNFLQLPHLYRAAFPDLTFDAPLGFDELVDAHVRLFPNEEEGLRGYFDLQRRFFDEMTHLSMEVALKDLDRLVEAFPLFFTYRTATLGRVVDEFVVDERLKGLLGAFWPYWGVPPSRLAFYTYSGMLNTVADHGYFYCEGSFQRLADAFAAALTESGGELLLETDVTRILVNDGRVVGVEIAGGRQIGSPIVISNVDATMTFEELVEPDAVPTSLLKRVRRLEPSLSAFVVYAATDLDLGALDAQHEQFAYRHWDHEQTYREILDGKPGGIWANVPTITDPSLAPDGQHLVIISALARHDAVTSWDAAKEQWTQDLLGLIEAEFFPGLGDHLEHVECATPQTLEAFTRHRQGAIYGWAVTPAQTGSKRLAHDTPIRGLYLSGHWTQEGPSSFRVILSGITTGRMVLDHMGRGNTVPTFRPADLPALH